MEGEKVGYGGGYGDEAGDGDGNGVGVGAGARYWDGEGGEISNIKRKGYCSEA